MNIPPIPNLDLARLAAIMGDADWLVDGLLGTGLSRPVDGPLRSVIEAMNRSGKPIFALDLPSGLDADTGNHWAWPFAPRPRLHSWRPSLASAPGASDYTGEVAVIDIGLPRCLLEPFRES